MLLTSKPSKGVWNSQKFRPEPLRRAVEVPILRGGAGESFTPTAGRAQRPRRENGLSAILTRRLLQVAHDAHRGGRAQRVVRAIYLPPVEPLTLGRRVVVVIVMPT